ncbi:MAG: hypothetical protein VX447_08880 [Pseudomonadota bacterium]|uniref:hypothetical protein n=1 Tax=Gallaecimonas pentaromativorans TaxID=584787 RepID=UPI00067F4FC2|nr:hypothetical protein [Gallaecimonas pentaromativorans]MED5524852.1 hypothetical protein [Pseudomonadota bacterium]
MKKTLLLFPLALALFGCGGVETLKQGLAQSQAISTDLKKALATDNLVSMNWHNGALSNVTVTFNAIPKEKNLDDIYHRASAVVAAHLSERPQQLVIAFALPPAPGEAKTLVALPKEANADKG